MMRTAFLLLCSIVPAFAQQLDIKQAIGPFQEQRNAALDAAGFCSLNLSQAQAEIAALKAKLAELEKPK